MRTRRSAARSRLNRINIPLDCDPIIDHMTDFYKKNPTNRDLHSEILDQIALEGLSGITFIRLMRILDSLFPYLDAQDENCQSYVWKQLTEVYLKYPADVKIHAQYVNSKNNDELEETAKEDKKIFIDKRIKLPNETVKRTAKIDTLLYPVQDGLIMGSCSNYSGRIDVAQELASQSLHDTEKKFGLNNLFFVASQKLRNKALLPNWADPNVDIKLREYCTLELIGKSRTLGTVFPNDKALGRYRIMLVSKGFITEFQLTSSSPVEHHLIRYSDSNKAPPKVVTSREVEDFICFEPDKLTVDRSIFKIVYEAIAQSDGVSQFDLRQLLQLPKFHIRNHLKNLLTIKMICSRVNNDENPFRIYRTAHKTLKKNIKVDVEKHTGVMATWDETDLKARKILGFKRSCFSQSEDSLLILSRITSILLDPRSKLSWCVHKHIIRDLLHKELDESKDKTSDACLRRIKYLKRLPNNIMSINELTAELSEDHEISRLVNDTDDEDISIRFIKLFKIIRAKIPNLLGITSGAELSRRFMFKDYKELKEKYELSDCQFYKPPLASLYESAKTSNVALVTMSYILTTHFSRDHAQIKLSYQDMLEKFYTKHTEKLVGSVLSKLNKRCLLTRKCPAEQALLFKPNTRMSLKLNQSVLFLLSRYQSSSLLHLTQPMSQPYTVDLDENNEMGSMAFLTSLLTSINPPDLASKIKIPKDVVVSGEQGDLIVQPSNIKFYCKTQLEQIDMEPFHSLIKTTDTEYNEESQQDARLWKKINGTVHANTLVKLIESLLSRIIVFPGIELDNLYNEFKQLLPKRHLIELLDLMEKLKLVTSTKSVPQKKRSLLFGQRNLDADEVPPCRVSYETTGKAHFVYCLLLNYSS